MTEAREKSGDNAKWNVLSLWLTVIIILMTSLEPLCTAICHVEPIFFVFGSDFLLIYGNSMTAVSISHRKIRHTYSSTIYFI